MDDDVAMAGTRPGVPVRLLSIGCSTAIIMRRAAKVQQSIAARRLRLPRARGDRRSRTAPLYHALFTGDEEFRPGENHTKNIHMAPPLNTDHDLKSGASLCRVPAGLVVASRQLGAS